MTADKETQYDYFLIFLILLMMFLLSSCSTAYRQRRDIQKLDVLSIQQPSEFLKLSTRLYPCTGVTKSDTIITFATPDTVLLKSDTVITRTKDTVTKTVTIPKKITYQKVVSIHDTIADTRKIAYLQDLVNTCGTNTTIAQTKLTGAQKEAKARLWYVIGLALVIIVYIVIKVYTFINGGWVKGVINKVKNV